VSSAKPRLRVLVVDDSAVQRQMLGGLLSNDPELEVAGFAANGEEALLALEALKPDVVTLDEKMPVMSGIETARRIMRERPTPIVMVTSAGGVRGRDLAEAALAAGVLAVQDKRCLSSGEAGAAAELVRAIKSMAAVRLVRRRREPGAVLPDLVLPRSAATRPELVAIGASTGGPQAIRTVLKQLPADFKLPILVVQHTTAGYSNTLVEWLRAEIQLPVVVAQDGQPLKAGVFVAPTERHLIVEGHHLTLLDTPPCSLHRPSATVLFRSVARAFGARAIGVLLTGMGDDGAAGLLEMKNAGALTVAQDEASCVVFGMPAEAIRMGGVERILAPEQIPALLEEHAR
jgi:two-component system, chemotaxis family, protein-glutamate methylesterase/glutaminase